MFDNAVKYSSEVPEIDVQLLTTKKKFMIEFADKGIGVDPQKNKKIFKSFTAATRKIFRM
ncbi:MAG: ATP-binding protein [Melioribacteraceae bacterium]|nr:ATP-binding protein [Melioribacteraceae bacterium]